MLNPYTVGGYFIAGANKPTVGTYYPPLYPNRWWHHGAGNGLPARVQCALRSGALKGCNCEPGCGYFNSQHNW